MIIYIACSSSAGPDTRMRITSVTPERGPAGASVSISGINFGDPSGYVTFSGIKAAISSWEDKEIAAIVPAESHPGNLVVTTPGNQSDSIYFIVETIILDSIRPDPGIGGCEVSIYGSLFGNLPDTVLFGNMPAEIVSWTDSLIHAIVPMEASSGNVIVKSDIEESNCLAYNIAGPIEFLQKCESINVILLAQCYYEYKMDEWIIDTQVTASIIYIENEWEAHPLVWDGASFSVSYKQHYFGQDKSYESLMISGNLAADGKNLENVSAFCYTEGTNFSGYSYSICKRLDLNDLVLDSVDLGSESMIFGDKGYTVLDHIAEISHVHYYSDSYVSGRLRYLDCDWHNRDMPPELTVSFSLKRPED